MTIQEAINFVDIARMGYICDPNECGLKKGGDPCIAFHCDEFHDALVMAIDALEKQIPKKVVYKMGCHGGALCPNCRTMFEYRMDNWKSPFCQHCGQVLDWRNTNE